MCPKLANDAKAIALQSLLRGHRRAEKLIKHVLSYVLDHPEAVPRGMRTTTFVTRILSKPSHPARKYPHVTPQLEKGDPELIRKYVTCVSIEF